MRLCVLGKLWEWGYDAKRCPDAGRPDSPNDAAIIAIAAREGRILLTDDLSTMPHYFVDYVADGNDHPGMLLALKAWPLREYLRCLKHTLETTRPEDLRNTYHWLKRPVPAGGAE